MSKISILSIIHDSKIGANFSKKRKVWKFLQLSEFLQILCTNFWEHLAKISSTDFSKFRISKDKRTVATLFKSLKISSSFRREKQKNSTQKLLAFKIDEFSDKWGKIHIFYKNK